MRFSLAVFFGLFCSSPTLAISPEDRATLDIVSAAEVYRGKVHLPDFKGRDRQFADFRTRIINGLRAGANFAGDITLIEIGCGSSCRFVYAGELRSGRVHSFPLGGEDNLSLRLYYRPDSRAVVAYWQDAGRCLRSVVTWTGSEFRSEKAADVGDQDVCYVLSD